MAIMAMSNMDGVPLVKTDPHVRVRADAWVMQSGKILDSSVGTAVPGLRWTGHSPVRREEQEGDRLSEEQRAADKIEKDVQHDPPPALNAGPSREGVRRWRKCGADRR